VFILPAPAGRACWRRTHNVQDIGSFILLVPVPWPGLTENHAVALRGCQDLVQVAQGA